MDLLCNPNHADVLALNMRDSVRFLQLNTEKLKTGVLTKDDFSFAIAPMPSLPQQVDSYNVTCMSWCALGESSVANALALGLASGRVMLLRPKSGVGGMHVDNVLLHQASKQPCGVTALAWNKSQPELLAMGLERSRTENSLLIWDISAYAPKNEASSSSCDVPNMAQKSEHELCYAEAVNSIMWTKNEAKTLVAGVSSKYLRMYDLRSMRPPSNVTTKATFGLCQDPCLDSRFASFFENQVHVWDLRNFSKPAAVIPAKFNILKAEWCPTRKGLLATISSGSTDGQVVRVYDMSHTMVTDSDIDIAYRHVEQIVKLDLGADDRSIGTFAWRLDSKNHLIVAANDGTLHCANVPERISVGWTKDSRLLSACKQLYQCFDLQAAPQKSAKGTQRHVGIEQIICERASNGYGIADNVIHSDPRVNLEPDNGPLHTFWKWIKLVKDSSSVTVGHEGRSVKPNSKALRGWHRHPPMTSAPSGKFSGLHSELKQSSSSSQSISWIGVPNAQCTIYKSKQRSRALKMCNWISIDELRTDDSDFKTMLLELRATERAAAIALWHLDMQLAIEILRRGGMQHSVVAMAFSGYTGNGAAPLWLDMCKSVQEGLPSPYLRAAFSFLSAKAGGKVGFKTILQSSEISVLDRIGFMCMYLADDALNEVLEDLAETAASTGNLEGVAATGLTNQKGFKLLQSYLDRTKDVQTAALALIQTGSSDVLMDQNVSHIIESYRSLLSTWMLWKERALLDNAIGKLANQRLKQQSQGISVQCNFCGKSVRHNSRSHPMRGRGVISLQGSGMTSKHTSCPNCRKPLPRCSSCCIYLGTPQADEDDSMEYQENGDHNLDCWFTWCPSCKHGGHTDHLTLWFNEHSDCPVSGCPCKCLNDKT